MPNKPKSFRTLAHAAQPRSNPDPSASQSALPPPTNSYTVPTGGFDGVGNILASQDSIMGNWTYQYDVLNRLLTGSASSGPDTNKNACWSYDGEGRRVAKGTITTMNCDPASNGFSMTGNNASTYVLGQDGEELTQLGQNNAWQRTNIFGAGKQLATYDSMGLHFQIEDALGTRRMQTNADGQPETDIQSLPFGDALVTANDQYAPATADDATPLHFTGKERDTESGNDYFGARYYASSMGRFLSPDYTDDGLDPAPVPWADYTNPQSLNLYSYVRNSPLTNVDSDGHDCVYINNDTGVYENFKSGDCDNTDPDKANSGYYFDGTIDTLYTSTGDLSGQVTGFSGTNDSTGTYDFDPNPAGVNPGPSPSTGGFDSGTLGAQVFGASSAPTWNAAAGAVSVCVRTRRST